MLYSSRISNAVGRSFSWAALNVKRAFIWMLKGRHFVMSHRHKWDTSVVSFISAGHRVGRAFTERVYVVTELIFLTRNILPETSSEKIWTSNITRRTAYISYQNLILN